MVDTMVAMPDDPGPDLPLPAPTPAEVLMLLGDTSDLSGLRRTLGAHGLGVDAVHTRGDALARFFATGGHRALLLAPDAPPGLAWPLAEAIRDMDAGIPVVAFGAHLCRSQGRLAHAVLIPDHHPDSRSGEVQVLRALGLIAAQPDLL